MGAILIVRTYVLYGKNRLILICLCTIAMAVVGSATWGLVTAPSLAYRESQLPPRGCILPISLESIQSFMPAILLGMSAEVVVFVLTLYKSIQIIQKENSVVLRILLRDGALYFGVVMLANMAVIVSYYAFDDYSRGNVVTLTNSLYATLVSRLILNLRDPALSSDIHFRLYPFNYYAGSRIIRRGRGQTATGDIFTSVIMTYDGGTGDGSTPNEEEEGCSCSVCQESFEEYSGYPSTSLGRSGAYSGDSDARSMASMESSLSMQKERYCYAV
ncbi:hypothetical protein CC2G_007469 [Coprinopsis cinerea AmutBmut pab1-1]|nr:hypothetical protein CC2G_007469 [Coprinopsis cinerea AmutBmut pab1-1]